MNCYIFLIDISIEKTILQLIRYTIMDNNTEIKNSDYTKNNYKTKKVIFRAHQIVWYILGIIEILLAFRFILKLAGANPESGFVSFIYSASNIFAQPFYSIFHVTVTYKSVFEWSTLVAMFVYLVIAYGVVKFIQLVNPTTPDKVKETID